MSESKARGEKICKPVKMKGIKRVILFKIQQNGLGNDYYREEVNCRTLLTITNCVPDTVLRSWLNSLNPQNKL